MDEIFATSHNKTVDPARRWLRHTYQEGPGFRFLATRGGRPRGARELRDRQIFRRLEDAERGLDAFVRYYNYHRLHGEIGWLTPAERFDGTAFTDRGFDNVPALAHLVSWLDDVRKAA